jgi:hypothetical protein
MMAGHRSKFPDLLLVELAAMDIAEDASKIRQLLLTTQPHQRVQLTFSDAGEGEEPGLLRLCTIGPGGREISLPLVQAWDSRINDRELEVTEPVRWAFCLALAGFVMLEWMYQ